MITNVTNHLIKLKVQKEVPFFNIHTTNNGRNGNISLSVYSTQFVQLNPPRPNPRLRTPRRFRLISRIFIFIQRKKRHHSSWYTTGRHVHTQSCQSIITTLFCRVLLTTCIVYWIICHIVMLNVLYMCVFIIELQQWT